MTNSRANRPVQCRNLKNNSKEHPQQHGAQDGSGPESHGQSETGATLVKLWWHCGGTPVEPRMVEPSAEPFSSSTRIGPERLQNLGHLGYLAKTFWWNPGGTLGGTLRIGPRKPEKLRNLGHLLTAQHGSDPENQRESETWATLLKLWWNLGGTLDLTQKTRETPKRGQPC